MFSFPLIIQSYPCFYSNLNYFFIFNTKNSNKSGTKLTFVNILLWKKYWYVKKKNARNGFKTYA